MAIAELDCDGRNGDCVARPGHLQEYHGNMGTIKGPAQRFDMVCLLGDCPTILFQLSACDKLRHLSQGNGLSLATSTKYANPKSPKN
ncbi:MAG: hypothetical protein IMY78_02895 [Chloroflexi bacterium]|nr:hypothetical protein [Chloroflexota bacterium]